MSSNQLNGERPDPQQGSRSVLSEPGAAVQVRKATERDLQEIGALLAQSFFDDPVMRWWISDDLRRQQLLPGLMEFVTAASLAHDSVYTTDDLVSAAVWVPPGKQPSEEEMEQLGPVFEQVAQEYTPGAFKLLTLREQKHPKQDHHYLYILGTRPEFRGKGVGSALPRPFLVTCDQQEIPAYLEATSEDNKRLYLRHGFEVVDEIHLPDGPTMWCMWRNPRRI